MEVLKKLSKARTQLLLDKKYIFWATIGMYQQLIESTSVPTMATDGEHLYYNKEFVEKLSNQELMFVLAHEAGHCAFGHHLRRQARDPFKWNVAADYALNQVLVDPPCNMKGLKTMLQNEKYRGMSSEAIYNQVKVIEIQVGGAWDCGGVMDAPRGADGAGDKSQERKWDIIVRAAAQQAKGQGFLPGDFEYLLKPLAPKLDLHAMLRHLISTTTEDDYSWARPNKKHIWNNLYLPSQRTESVGDIMVGIDVSGSISNEEAAKFLGVVNLVLTDLKPKTVHFVQCDAAIQKHEEFKRGDLLPEKVAIKGGGGTDMRPFWEWTKHRHLSCAIVCSDFQMREEDFGKKQEFPVLWVTTSSTAVAPWGMTARLKD